MKVPSAAPLAVVPPPMSMRTPLASRRRRREVRPFGEVASLISYLQRAQCECRQCCRNLRRYWRAIVQPACFGDAVELLDHDAATVDRCRRACNFFIPARDIAISGKYRHATTGIANEIL